MEMKTFSFVSFVGMGVLFGAFGFAGKVEAREDTSPYIYLSNYDLRSDMIYNVTGGLRNAGFDEERVSLTEQLYEDYGLFSKEDAKHVKYIETEASDDYKSVEGIEYFSNATYAELEGGQLLDLSPISKLTKLEYLGIATTASVSDINFVKPLVNLVDVNIQSTAADSEGVTKQAITDISALSELPKLKYIRVATSGDMPTISLREGYRKYEVLDPIIPSSQFDDYTIKYTSYGPGTFTNTDGLLKWNAIPFGTESLELSWFVRSNDWNFVYEGTANIPIVWK